MIYRKIKINETNIQLKTDIEPHGLTDYIVKLRTLIKNFIIRNPDFLTSLEPLKIYEGPLIVKKMLRSGVIANTGPMAAVAGTIAQFSMNYLLNKDSKYVIVDNGGDISLKTDKDVVIGLFAGLSSLSGKIGFKIKSKKTPMGICTSSGTIGHSISFGRADSVTVFADEASIADALATSIANEANGESDQDTVENCIYYAENFREYMNGAVVIVGEYAGTIGKIPKMIQTDKKVVLGDFFDLI
ncbi:MAG: UPF0280 family protein [Methanobacteriaceae archaeon]|nr:UPF0280 family protein [Methanobacteriaceae archaeon]